MAGLHALRSVSTENVARDVLRGQNGIQPLLSEIVSEQTGWTVPDRGRSGKEPVAAGPGATLGAGSCFFS